jgi:hypothetical protein
MAAMYSRPYQVAVTAKTTRNSAMIAAWLVVIEYRLHIGAYFAAAIPSTSASVANSVSHGVGI